MFRSYKELGLIVEDICYRHLAPNGAKAVAGSSLSSSKPLAVSLLARAVIESAHARGKFA